LKKKKGLSFYIHGLIKDLKLYETKNFEIEKLNNFNNNFQIFEKISLFNMKKVILKK
jgi:hypothetical protein